MRPFTSSALSLPFLFASLASSLTLNCEHIRIDGKKFDIHKLGGPRSVFQHDESRPPAMHNITWTVDICQPLRKDKNIPNADQCPTGTRVCGIDTVYNPNEKTVVPVVDRVIPVAGNFQADSGRQLEPKYTRLKASDTEKEGLQIELNGGYFADKKQRAIIEFQCDKSRSGNEGNEEETRRRSDKKTQDKDDDEEDIANNLSYVSYGAVDEKLDVLRLNWRTKYACEDYVEDDDDDEGGSKKGGWGFFTWFILIAFLATATYLIFGSWLNYNRYGARGWDLLPHGDTIRDIPYLFKDWSRKVVDTVSGGGVGGRGGYSAV